MLEIVHDGSSQDSRTCKLQKEEFSFCEARPIERYVRLIENRVLQILNKAQAHENVWGFSLTLQGIKRKTLVMF